MSRRYLIRLAVLLSLIILVVIVVLELSSYFNQPSLGVISYPKQSLTKSSLSTKIKLIKFYNQYASFSYPNGFVTYTSSKPSGQVLTSASFIEKGPKELFLAVSILDIAGGSLKDNNAYELRLINPSEYQIKSEVIGNKSIVVSSNNTPTTFNQVAFLVNANYQATMALSANQPTSSNLVNLFKLVVSSWQWRRKILSKNATNVDK